MKLKHFSLDESCISEVTVRTETSLIKDPDNPTFDDLIKILKGHDKIVSVCNKDHDQFTELRNQLEREGFIQTQRSYWNGDIVLKSFYLNEWKFIKGHRFPCAAAIKASIAFARKHGRKTLSVL